MKDKNLPFILLTIAVFVFLILPGVFREGLFMDGLMYAAISNNLSLGLGTFWTPYFSATFLPQFHEHPPLVFGIQSVFFSMFGSGFWVEKFYSFFTAIIQALLLVFIWRNTMHNFKNLFWLPILLWITIPLCFWSYKNNTLENTMAVFTTSAILLQVMAFRNNLNYILLALAGFCIFCGFLSKGFPAFFPLVFPVIHWFFLKKHSVIKYTGSVFLILFSTAACFAILFLMPNAIESLDYYLNTQVAQSLKGERVVMERYYIIKKLFLELIPSLSVVIIVSLIAKIKRINFYHETITWAWIFLLAGISASFPIVISPKQLGFYLVPSLPLFALAASIFIVPLIQYFLDKINYKSIRILNLAGIVAIVVTIIFSLTQTGSFERDKSKITDVKHVGAIVGEGNKISICPGMYQDWSLHGYFMRYFGISLENNLNNIYILDDNSCNITSDLRKVTDLNNYTLYKK